jgi:hypothetical protein
MQTCRSDARFLKRDMDSDVSVGLHVVRTPGSVRQREYQAVLIATRFVCRTPPASALHHAVRAVSAATVTSPLLPSSVRASTVE